MLTLLAIPPPPQNISVFAGDAVVTVTWDRPVTPDPILSYKVIVEKQNLLYPEDADFVATYTLLARSNGGF